MCTTSIESVFFYLTPCRRKLLEARRTKDGYDPAKIRYDQFRKQFQVALETWKGQEYLQIQENRRLLKRASTLIQKKAEEFINKAIETTLKNCKFGIIQPVRPKNSLLYLC